MKLKKILLLTYFQTDTCDRKKVNNFDKTTIQLKTDRHTHGNTSWMTLDKLTLRRSSSSSSSEVVWMKIWLSYELG